MNETYITELNLRPHQQWIYAFLGCIIVAFGQPAWISWMSPLAAMIGYGIFFRVLLDISSPFKRFWAGLGWYVAVQAIQLSWFLSHPYLYIYGVYFFTLGLKGIQFGILSLLVTPNIIKGVKGPIFIAACWTLMEWSRIFWFSGYSWNPAGIALTSNIYSLQFASIWGVYGLSFWVILVNVLAVKVWMARNKGRLGTIFVSAALFPYLFGLVHFTYHQHQFRNFQQTHEPFRAILVQTAFPAEEAMHFGSFDHLVKYVIGEWKQILKIIQKHEGKDVDLIVLPEFVVPFGTFSFAYPYEEVKQTFFEIYGDKGLEALPKLELPLAAEIPKEKGTVAWMVNNAYWSEAIANLFQTDIIVGLEDAEQLPTGNREYYSAGIYFRPLKILQKTLLQASDNNLIAKSEERPFSFERYEKRVLVPMGEYIPFEWCKELAANYGVSGSITSGKCAKIHHHQKGPLSMSICYEETFGDLIRECRKMGAEMLVNLTSDVWYPNSRLPKQHFDHARLRSVEGGIPLLRACNTGVTGTIDSLGRIVSILGEENTNSEWLSDSLYVECPTYTYATLYSRVGDGLIIGLSLLAVLLFLRFR